MVAAVVQKNAALLVFFQNSEVSIGVSQCGVKECSVY